MITYQTNFGSIKTMKTINDLGVIVDLYDNCYLKKRINQNSFISLQLAFWSYQLVIHKCSFIDKSRKVMTNYDLYNYGFDCYLKY